MKKRTNEKNTHTHNNEINNMKNENKCKTTIKEDKGRNEEYK